MRTTTLFTLFSFVSISAIAACGSSTIVTTTHGQSDGGGGETVEEDAGGGVNELDAGGGAGKDAGKTTGKDAGPKQQAGPASPIPQVTYNGGSLLTAPSIVTVTFDSDVNRTTLESFGDTISATGWWDAVREGYCDSKANCIQRGTGGGHVHLPTNAAGASYSDTAGAGASTMKTFIDGYITSHTFPTPTSNTLYMIYFPSSTSITLDGAGSCQQFGGYHNSMTASLNGVNVAYAIMPFCNTGGGAKADLDELTVAASHELAEAATDPFVGSANAPYTGYGSDTDAWDILAGGEVGDRCVDFSGNGNVTESGFSVQRIWNNTAAKGNHDPCVPAPDPATQPYFNISPVGGDVLNIAVGSKQVVEVEAFSDGPMSPILWGAQDQNGQTTGNGLTLSTDGSQLAIGNRGHVTVQLDQSPAQGYVLFYLVAQSGNTSHIWPMLVQ